MVVYIFFVVQSFVMRQTVALSAKNKQLTNALIQSRQTSSELDKNLQKMQVCANYISKTL